MPQSPDTETDTGSTALPSEPFILEKNFAGRQYVGQRRMQEDYYAFSDISSDQPSGGHGLLVALGDGLGAHLGGHLASYLIVNEFIKAYKQSSLSSSWRLRVALETANEKLLEVSCKLSSTDAPMGSTLVGAALTGRQLHWVSVGDSILLLHRKGELMRLNADHSLAPIIDQRLRNGEITREEARHHPDRHLLQSACMGQPLTIVDAHMDPYELESGDIIIVASDGILTLEMSDLQQMLTTGNTSSAGKIADSIIFAVRCADLPRQDNATVCVVKVP